MNTHDKYYWVQDHPAFSEFGWATIDLTPHMVNPVTKEVNLTDPSENTELNWWIEVYYDVREYPEDETSLIVPHHPLCLDTGGVTVDDAIDNLYKLTLEHYGDYSHD